MEATRTIEEPTPSFREFADSDDGSSVLRLPIAVVAAIYWTAGHVDAARLLDLVHRAGLAAGTALFLLLVVPGGGILLGWTIRAIVFLLPLIDRVLFRWPRRLARRCGAGVLTAFLFGFGFQLGAVTLGRARIVRALNEPAASRVSYAAVYHGRAWQAKAARRSLAQATRLRRRSECSVLEGDAKGGSR